VEDGYDVMLMGDFNLPNIDWSTSMIKSGSPQATIDAAEELLHLMDSHFLDQHVMDDTRSTNILDLFITNNETIFQDIEVVDTPLSDHRIVKIFLTDDPAYQPIVATKEFEKKLLQIFQLGKSRLGSD
jgi:endonuclease/exonuclease/phosphatase family metal-dependent hydrolase